MRIHAVATLAALLGVAAPTAVGVHRARGADPVASTRRAARTLPPAASPATVPPAAGPPAGAARIPSVATAALRVPAGAGAARLQDFPYHPYTARWTFVRIRTNMGGGRNGFGRGFRGRDPGWHHDYPDADRNFSKILNEITYVFTLLDEWGGNILTFDDPRLSQFPIAYVSEPGQWSVTPEEAKGLRDYLLKGGFVIFDDFGGYDMYNLAEQMKIVMPEHEWLRLDATDAVFDSFFKIDPDHLILNRSNSYRGDPEFWGLFEGNDHSKRMIAIAGNDGDFGEFWEFSDRGFYPIDLSNEAYKVGVNYVIYALTH